MRTSIRKYTDQPLSDTLLNDLLEKSFRASNTGNMQTYSVIVTRSEEKKKALAPFHFNQPMICGAPVVLTFCADFYRFSEWCKARNAEPCYNNFLSFISATIDATIVAQTFAMLAEEAGLGICYLGTTNYMAAEISQVLELPELVVPITTITVGYPAETPAPTDRLPASGLIHQETYKEVDIDALYAEKEALPAMQQFVKDNNKETLAQVFTDIRYNKTNNEAFSKRLWQALQQAGFVKD
jgi:nitroreductase